MSEQSNTQAPESRYLIFKVGEDLYGTPLLDVREVVQYQAPKPMPNMSPAFTGVINIRGAIVGVLDFRVRLGIEANLGNKTALLVLDTTQGALAVTVDQVESVVPIPEEELDRKPPVMSKIPTDYLVGIAKHGHQLITIVHLHQLMSNEKLIGVAA
jgi:purine-binding chemotaxis protein CheW